VQQGSVHAQIGRLPGEHVPQQQVYIHDPGRQGHGAFHYFEKGSFFDFFSPFFFIFEFFLQHTSSHLYHEFRTHNAN
jgi:hypothetical protein